MADAIVALQNTPVPTILVVGGIVFLFLGVVGQFVGQITVPAPRQKWALLIGIVLLAAGVALYASPPSRTPQPTAIPTTVVAAVTSTPVSPAIAPSSTNMPFPTSPSPTNTPIPTATLLPAPTLGIGSRKTAADGSLMMYVPAGDFLMGSSDADKNALPDEKPQHKVQVDAFWISKYAVTNALYKKCVDVRRCIAPSGAYWPNGIIPSIKENHPVVGVSWNDALAYAQWIGGRLPTEAEWEKAACWDEAKKAKRMYPWGDLFDFEKANTSESGINSTTPVDKYSPQGDSPYGVSDMAGNVRQWTGDWYSDAYYTSSPQINPKGPDSGGARAIRGGSWGSIIVTERCTFRSGVIPGYRADFIGFRVVESIP